MDDLSLSSMIMWSIVTGIAMLVVGFSYSVYLKRHIDEFKDECNVDTPTPTPTKPHPPTAPDIDILNDNHPVDTLDTPELRSQLSSDAIRESQSDTLSNTSSDTNIANHDTNNTKTNLNLHRSTIKRQEP